MKLIYLLLSVLLFLLTIILIAALAADVPEATGIAHSKYPGMFISPTNIDHNPLTKWLGYLFGAGIIFVFGVMLLIGNRKKGKLNSMKWWLFSGFAIYLIAYSLMVVSHWSYTLNDNEQFFMWMPKPTAWMIYVVWFVPFLITTGYILKFEEAIISEEEEESFYKFLKESKVNQD